MFEENKEEWITISENENYEVSNLAQIRNKQTKKILKKHITEAGYERIGLHYSQLHKSKLHLVHILVAQAFILNPENFPFINHKDRNKTNNRVTNLEWVNHSMNMKHCVKTGRNQYKRAVRQRDLEGNEVAIFDSLEEAAKVAKCTSTNIGYCAN